MASNFDFLEGHRFHDELLRAEKYQLDDPGGAAGKIRKVMENAVKDYYEDIRHLKIREVPIKKINSKYPSLGDLIDFDSFTEIIDNDAIVKGLHRVRLIGNKGVHEINFKDKVIEYLSILHSFLKRYSFDILGEEIFDEFNHRLEFVANDTQSIKDESNSTTKQYTQQEEQFEEGLKEVFEKQEESDAELLEKLKEEERTIMFSSVGITELMGKIWGRVFINFTYLNENYHAVKYFRPEPKATEKFKIGKGDFEFIGLFTMFEKKHVELSKENVLKGTSDQLNLAGNFPKRYGTPSILLKKLLSEVEEYFKLEESKLKVDYVIEKKPVKFQFKGHYYKNNESKFRNILEIYEEDTPINAPFELIVVMINPGGSKPITNAESNWGSFPSIHHGVDCKPDETQNQIVKLMKMNGWKKGVVLNLFDKCNVNSEEIIERYTLSENKNAYLAESVFHKSRRKELESIFELADQNAPIVLAWGAEKKLLNIKKSIYNRIIKPSNRIVVGWEIRNYQFYHPWVRKRDDIRENWPSVIYEQLKST